MNALLRASLLLSCLLLALPSMATAKDLGQLIDKRGVVKKAFQGQPATIMERQDSVKVPLQVDTYEKSGARFAIGSAQGAVTMGPESQFTFEAGDFDPDTGRLLDELRLKIAKGKFWFWFARPKGQTVLGAHPREVVIGTGSEPIHLRDTAVYLRVEQNGITTLYVAEGIAIVGEPGKEVQVKADHWTIFGPGLPPRRPMPGHSDPTKKGSWPEIPGPVLLDPGSPRLDLPKSRWP